MAGSFIGSSEESFRLLHKISQRFCALINYRTGIICAYLRYEVSVNLRTIPFKFTEMIQHHTRGAVVSSKMLDRRYGVIITRKHVVTGNTVPIRHG